MTEEQKYQDKKQLQQENSLKKESRYSLPLSATEEDYQELAEQGYRREEFTQRVTPAPPPPPQPEAYREIPTDEKGFSVRALTESAMMIAIALLLGMIASYVPVASFLGYLLFPLPIAILVLRRGAKVGIAASIALTALSVLFMGIAQALLLTIQYGVAGVFLGWCFRKQKSSLFTLAWTAVISAIGTALGLMLSVYVSGLPLSSIIAEMREMATQYTGALEQSGMLESALPPGMTVEDYTQLLMDTMEKLIPAAFIVSSMVMTLVMYLASTTVLRRLRYRVPVIAPFANWRLDWRFIWGLIFGLFFRWAGVQFQVDWLATLGLNLTYIFLPVLVLCGISLLVWCWKNLGLNPWIKITVVMAVVMFFAASLFLLGLFAAVDAVKDLRKPLKRWADKKNANPYY